MFINRLWWRTHIIPKVLLKYISAFRLWVRTQPKPISFRNKMASTSETLCDPRSEKSLHNICADCSTQIRTKVYKLSGTAKKTMREILEEKSGERIFETDLLCNSCYQKLHKKLKTVCETTVTLSNETEDSPDETELKVKCVKGSKKKCLICEDKKNIRVSDEIRLSIFEKRRIFVPNDYRICEKHLIDNKLNPLLFSVINSIGYVTLEGPEVHEFLQLSSVINEINSKCCFIHKEDYPIFTGLTEEEFHIIHDKYLFGVNNTSTRSTQKALGIYLTKLRTSMSNQEIASLFRISNYNCVTKIILNIRQKLIEKLVNNQFDFKSLNRKTIITHMSPLVKLLYCKNEEAVTMWDGTYSFIQKSGSNEFQRKTYSVQKGRHLIKPMIAIAADGFIIGIFGPYQANNNDAFIMNKIVTENKFQFERIFKSEDIFIVDRGFRDAKELINNYRVEMPSCSSGQLNSFEANKTRFVTKVRYKIEVVNGRLKRFKLLSSIRANQSVETLIDDWRIAGALFNEFFQPIESDECRVEWIASRFHLRLAIECTLKDIALKFDRKRLVWRKFDQNILQDFPKLCFDDIYSLTLGSYQIRRCKSYVLEHISSKIRGYYEIEVCCDPDFINDVRLIRVKIQSRHKTSKQYNVYIEYEPNSTGYDSIKRYFCKCNTGCRTVGMCSHITSIIWYLGFVRHQKDYTLKYKDLLKIFDTEAQEESENEDD